MVCSSCGFENQAAMRFCGMCGTPLPHRPLTTPGAQSTLGFTRVPVEGSGTQHASVPMDRRTGVVEQLPEVPVNGNRDVPVVESEAASGAPAKELVPDIPLDQYIQNFRYDPPKDAGEFTMRGEAPPVIDSTTTPVARDVVSTSSTTQSSAGAVESRVENATEANQVHAAAEPEDSVVSRLGLEPESEAETKINRPRFLDINDAPRAERPAANSGTSTIVGPSFLGLSDAPLPAGETEAMDLEDEAHSSSHWRAWLAIAVLLIFGAMALLEWRSQSRQTFNGPVEVIRMKMKNMRQKGDSQAATATSSSNDPNAKPDMQVVEPPKPQPQPPAAQTSTAQTTPPTASPANQPNPAANANVSPSNSNAPAQPTTTAKAEPPPAKASPAPAERASRKTEIPQPKASSDDNAAAESTAGSNSKRRVVYNDDQLNARLQAPGAEELARAKNASDSAAAAAWLWRATAKGNPEAPVQLADMYAAGNGVPRSCEQALVLLRTASAKQNALARTRLATMYANGNCVQRNRVEAYRWLNSALDANPNSQWAQQNRDLIWRQMTPDERAMAEQSQ